MPREVGKATAQHKAYAAYLTETTGQKISPNTVAAVLISQGEFRQSQHYSDLKDAEAEAKADRDAAVVEAKRQAYRDKLAALGEPVSTPAKAAPAKRAPRKAAAPAAPRGQLKAVEDAPPVDDDDFSDADDF